MRHPINMPQVIRGWLDIWVGVYLDVCDWGWWTWLWGWRLVMVFHKFRVPVPEWVGQMISFTILKSTIQFLWIPFCTLLKLKHYTILFFSPQTHLSLICISGGNHWSWANGTPNIRTGRLTRPICSSTWFLWYTWAFSLWRGLHFSFSLYSQCA